MGIWVHQIGHPTLKLPSNVTILNNLKIISWNSYNGKDYIDYTHYYGSSVTVRVLSYTSKTIYLTCDYEYTSALDKKDYGKFEFQISISEPYFDFSVSPSGGKVKKGQTVTFNCWVTNVENFSSSDVKYYYTLDGSTPTQNSTPYNGFYGVTIDKSCTLKAIATWKGSVSGVLKADYTVEGLYLTADPAGGVVEKGTTVYLTASEYGADIYYTLDGYTPSRRSTPYSSSGIRINEDCTLKAIAYKDDMTSEVLSENYRLPVNPTGISVYLSSSTIKVGETTTAKYFLKPSNASTTITWTSEDSSIASVERSSGKVVGVSEGTTNIIATTSNGLTAQCGITVSGESNSYINKNNFPDVNFRSSILEQGIKTEEDVRKANKLDVAMKEIESLKGIELFTSLESLICYINKLSSLDVSKNTKLNFISCYNNNIHGANLDAFINSLPNNNTKNKRLIVDHVMNRITKYSSNGLTTSQVAKAKSKGWTPYYWCIMDDEFYEYEGYENSSTDETAIAIDATNFPDKNFRKYLIDQDFGKDGIISSEEISKITSIDCSKKEISNLKGIELFSSLKKIYCSSNKLTSLDVSKNAELEQLKCDDNQLTSLDVTKNASLWYLHCDSNQLTSLDISKNPYLTNLSCDYNPLTSLDISKNPNLHDFSCGYNQLTRLDVSKNKDLKDLLCYSNQIKGSAMDDLIKSLPQRNTNDGVLYVVVYPDDDGNVCTRTQVAAAKLKGWIAYYFNGSKRVEYEGSDPTDIYDVWKNADAKAPIYDLNGQRLDKPLKGINIIGGKKMIVK